VFAIQTTTYLQQLVKETLKTRFYKNFTFTQSEGLSFAVAVIIAL